MRNRKAINYHEEFLHEKYSHLRWFFYYSCLRRLVYRKFGQDAPSKAEFEQFEQEWELFQALHDIKEDNWDDVMREVDTDTLAEWIARWHEGRELVDVQASERREAERDLASGDVLLM